MKEITTTENIFYAEIRELLQLSRRVAYQAVNTVMVNTYWQIGKRIVEQEQHGESRANYGDYLIMNLSRYLSDTLGKGFSEANLRNMRQFYIIFPNYDQFSTHCVANLTWSHIRLIMRLESPAERSYYIKEAAEQNWTSRLLERMFDTLKRGEDDNPTIGIILCSEKDETIVKYSVLKESRQIFASKYKTVLPTEDELAGLFVKSKSLTA
jgi:hypothetical protein